MGSSTISLAKVLVVGDQGVGKTCFIRCLIGKDISAKYEPTVDDWYTHHILTKDGNQQKIHFLDTGSFQVHNELITYYVKMARLCIVVTDFKKKQSYQIAQKIVNFIHSIQDDMKVLCVCSKSDRPVAPDSPRDRTDYLQCSALSGEGFHDIYHRVIEMAFPVERNKRKKLLRPLIITKSNHPEKGLTPLVAKLSAPAATCNRFATQPQPHRLVRSKSVHDGPIQNCRPIPTSFTTSPSRDERAREIAARYGINYKNDRPKPVRNFSATLSRASERLHSGIDGLDSLVTRMKNAWFSVDAP